MWYDDTRSDEQRRYPELYRLQARQVRVALPALMSVVKGCGCGGLASAACMQVPMAVREGFLQEAFDEERSLRPVNPP